MNPHPLPKVTRRRHKNVDYTTISDRLWRVSLNSHPTNMVYITFEGPISPLPALVVQSNRQTFETIIYKPSYRDQGLQSSRQIGHKIITIRGDKIQKPGSPWEVCQRHREWCSTKNSKKAVEWPSKRTIFLREIPWNVINPNIL